LKKSMNNQAISDKSWRIVMPLAVKRKVSSAFLFE